MEKKTAMRVSILTMTVNFVLSIYKLLSGILASSGAMISDAVHSASDVFSTVIVMIGVQAAAKQSDKDHQYGHERMECVASIVLAVVLCVTGAGIGYKGIGKILAGHYDLLTVPGRTALIAAVVSIAVKEWMFWYTRVAAKKINSGALMADAWHHRSDALSSVGALIGVAGSRMGYPVLDSAASVIISILIIKAGYDIFRDAIDKMVDKACPEEEIEKMRSVILTQEGVLGIDLLRTRLFGNKIYVDIEIAADGNRPLNETHAVAECVHNKIEEAFPEVKHCMVHVNPFKETMKDSM